MAKLLTNNLGFPRIGENRKLKRATEAYWHGDIEKKELLKVAGEIKKKNWSLQRRAGINLIPSNDFSFYDHVLDTTCMLGAVPERFFWNEDSIDLDLYFRMARGVQEKETKTGDHPYAMEMTKWFDTNYHYLVPEFHSKQQFKRASNKPIDEFREALQMGIKTKPVLLGPISFLLLGKSKENGFSPIMLLGRLLPVYIEILKELSLNGAEWVQIDEPVMVLDLKDEELTAFNKAYNEIARQISGLKLILTFYFGHLEPNLKTALQLPVSGFHFDLIRGRRDLDFILDQLPADAVVSLGLINGRGIWRNNLSESYKIVKSFVSRIGKERVMIAPSCSLIHIPTSLKNEKNLDENVKRFLVFAEEKLDEISTLSSIFDDNTRNTILLENKKLFGRWSKNPKINNPRVKERIEEILLKGIKKRNTFNIRQSKQRKVFDFPLFPTTTIGSFPQTKDVRMMRLRFKKGEITKEQYDAFIRGEIEEVIKLQEELGLDVLVHGEFERNDMVEFFGEKLSGFTVTEEGWVQSYGTRYVKPPIIYGDVSRPGPMTVEIIKYAQSLTEKQVKAMLTGPITILQWSFYREDIPRDIVAKQIAIAIRDEVRDLEKAGIQIIQIDEPALREGLPLRKKDWNDYLKWAVEAFHIASSVVKDETHIHTHMCYSEFKDIIESIAELDADVISIETSRSQMELLDAFKNFRYPNEIGPGVYDVHSPHIPSTEQIEKLILKATTYIPKENLWVNPDCGLKTRSKDELIASLSNMVKAANNLRAKFSN